MIALVLAALAMGVMGYAVVNILLLSLSWLKNFIKDLLKKNPPGITEEAVISVQAMLEQTPTITLDDLGGDIQENDFLVVGIKEDNGVSDSVDIIRAKKVDDQVKTIMKKNGGAVKITV